MPPVPGARWQGCFRQDPFPAAFLFSFLPAISRAKPDSGTSQRGRELLGKKYRHFPEVRVGVIHVWELVLVSRLLLFFNDLRI